MPELTDSELKALHDDAYRAMDEGRLTDSARMFAALSEYDDDDDTFHYMQGLAHKYRRDWPASLAANLRAIETADKDMEGAIWNAAIAATALGDWARARALWADGGINIPAGEGPIDGDFGICSVRLNPWGEGETLFARRIDPVRTILLNIPLPESGYRWHDIVLNDGASTGSRKYGDGQVPVLNVLQRLHTSEYETFAVFVGAESEADIAALFESQLPGLGYVEDWTDSIHHLCLRCSYDAPHSSGGHTPTSYHGQWNPERSLGIAAQSRKTVERLLEQWKAGAAGRWVDAIEHRNVPLTDPVEGKVWWQSPAVDDEPS